MTISLLRTLILYVAIIIAIRLMGKRQISELQPSELVVTLLISDIAAIPMQNSSLPLVSGLVPIAVLIACELLISFFMVKSTRFRRLVCGKPIAVIKNGTIDQDAMKKLRMTTEDLSEQLRQADVFDLDEVDFAVVETNGNMSVLKKAQKQLPSADDMNITIEDNGMDVVVVSDGEFSDFSISFCGVTCEYVKSILENEGVNIKDVFIMTLNKNKKHKIIRKDISV